MRALVAVVVVVAAAARAQAAGLELVEQSATAAGRAGAATADAYEPAAAYYDPAALAFQRGLTVVGGAAVELYRGTDVSSTTLHRSGTWATPAVFVGQRVSARYAVGIGVYSPFAWSSSEVQPNGAFDLRTYDVNPTVAVRPWPWLALGFGVDIVPSTLDWRVAARPSSSAPWYTTSATGLGGNASLLVRALPRWLDLAVSYRSAVDLDLGGKISFVRFGGNDVTATLPLPHTFAFGVASRPARGLTLTTDVRLVLWHDLHDLTFTQTHPDPGMSPTLDSLQLGWQNAVGVRVGASWGLVPAGEDDEPRLTVRVGAGWEQSPASPANAPPVLAQGDRAIASAGLGGRLGALSLDVAYTVAIEPEFTGVSGTYVARYAAVTHALVAAVTVRLPDFPARLAEPAFKR